MTAKVRASSTIVRTKKWPQIMLNHMNRAIGGGGLRPQITVSRLGKNAYGIRLRSCVNSEDIGLENIALTKMHHLYDLQGLTLSIFTLLK